MINKKLLFQIAIIAILGFAVYTNSLNGEFIWDDEALVRDNIFIRGFSNLPKIFRTDIARGAAGQSNFYRPLQVLTYMIDYSLWKLDVRGYHLSNVLLHVLAGITLFWLVSIITGSQTTSFITAILFTVHPLHTGAVSYVAGRADSLALSFMLLCFIFYIKHLDHNKIKFYFLTLLAFVLALLSKEITLILPALLCLYHVSFAEKRKIFLKNGKSALFSIAFIAGAYIALRLTIFRPFLITNIYKSSLIQRIPGLFVAITGYVRLLFLPFNLHMEYGNRVFNPGDPRVITGVAIVVFFLAYAIAQRRKNSIFFFSIAWFFVALIPVSNIYPINAYMAEHWLYIPSIGVFLALGNILKNIYEKDKTRALAIVFTIALTVYFSYLTIKQNNYWNNATNFYEKTLEYSPTSPRVLNRLGMKYMEMGDIDKAVFLYEKALEADPRYAQAYINLGNVHKNNREIEKALLAYNKALEVKPDLAEAYNNLGIIYSQKKQFSKAINLYEKAIQINPNYGFAYNNLANTYNDMGEYEKAIPIYRKALSLVADKAIIRGNLERALKAIKK